MPLRHAALLLIAVSALPGKALAADRKADDPKAGGQAAAQLVLLNAVHPQLPGVAIFTAGPGRDAIPAGSRLIAEFTAGAAGGAFCITRAIRPDGTTTSAPAGRCLGTARATGLPLPRGGYPAGSLFLLLPRSAETTATDTPGSD